MKIASTKRRQLGSLLTSSQVMAACSMREETPITEHVELLAPAFCSLAFTTLLCSAVLLAGLAGTLQLDDTPRFSCNSLFNQSQSIWSGVHIVQAVAAMPCRRPQMLGIVTPIRFLPSTTLVSRLSCFKSLTKPSNPSICSYRPRLLSSFPPNHYRLLVFHPPSYQSTPSIHYLAWR